MKGDFVVAIDGDLGQVAVPALARIDPQLLAGPAGQRVPGAFDVLRRKRLAVVPLDTRAQTKSERSLVLVPRPALGEIGPDRLEGILRNMLIEEDEVVENGHHRGDGDASRLLVYRHARRAVADRHS